MLEDFSAVAVHVLAQLQAGADTGDQLSQLALAHRDRHGAQILAVELDKAYNTASGLIRFP